MEIANRMEIRAKIKRRTYLELILILAIIVLLNYISSQVFTRIDLTREHRYTLASTTVDMLEDLNDVVFVKVYLEGDMPYGFKRLKNSIKEALDEFRIYAGDNIQYEFINPSLSSDRKTRNEIYKQLYAKGLTPTNLQQKDDEGKTSQQILFPGAIVSYKGYEAPVDFLKNNVNYSPEQNLNGSIEEVEFGLVTAIRNLNRDISQRIAFIEGHGELPEIEVADITSSLSQSYNVERVSINERLGSLSERIVDSTGIHVQNKYDLLIIADPDSAFSERDKYIIDQFIMYGGRVLWIIDAVDATMDSLAYSSSIVAGIKELNLGDQLFKYGARVNPNLIQDIQCALIPVNTAIAGEQPQFSGFGWVYFPLVVPSPNHPITKNLNLVKTQFVSSIDTVGESSGIKKTILLQSSRYSRLINAPVRVSLDIIQERLDPAHFTHSYQPIAVLLEGKFMSVYENRLVPSMYDSKEIAFSGMSVPTKMVVISDGDIIRNPVKKLGFNESALPLGYDRYTGETYGNKEFLMNVVNYLLDDKGYMQLRSRELKLRLLDKAEISNNRLFWQMINALVPVILIILMGMFIAWRRKIRFAKVKKNEK